MTDRMGKNYNTDGGNRTVIGGILEFAGDADVKGFPGAANLKPKDSNTAADIRDDLNTLIKNLKNAGVMIPDAWNLSALACPTPASMPTEATAANSGHATVSVEDNVVTITLDCKVSALFGIRTGLGSVEGIKFTDDTGAEVTLGSGDASEASALGLSAGDFVLFIKAEDPKYLTGEKYFTLWADGYATTRFAMKIVEGT